MQYISRISQTNKIIENFTSPEPSNQIYMITGIRGLGKTVMMTAIANEIKKNEEWIVVELNLTRDLLQSLAGKQYSLLEMHTHFVKAKIDFSALGFGISPENASPVADIESAIELMLAQLSSRRKRLLVTVDEITNCEFVRIFSSAFQIFLRQEYPVFLLMTGLYDNIYNLQNEKSLTFLYRAPKIILEPLNYTAVRKQYMDIFELDMEKAGEMAGLTKGYPFAFQVLGYLFWESKNTKTIEEILPEYDQRGVFCAAAVCRICVNADSLTVSVSVGIPHIFYSAITFCACFTSSASCVTNTIALSVSAINLSSHDTVSASGLLVGSSIKIHSLLHIIVQVFYPSFALIILPLFLFLSFYHPF